MSRPKGRARKIAEQVRLSEGCSRSKSNAGFMVIALTALNNDADAFSAVIGCKHAEIVSGARVLPKGWMTAANEIGRYIETTGDDGVAALIADARRRGLSFADIAANFRSLRLGVKEGNAVTLSKAIIRTINEYLRRFPNTSQAQLCEALEHVYGVVKENASESDGAR